MLDKTGLTTFIANQNKLAGVRHVIVKLTDGTSTWLISDCDMELTDGHVHALLDGISDISSSANPLTKEWSVGDVTINLINLPYKDTAAAKNVRPSDEMSGILGKDVYIYFMAGPCTALSQCLLRFYGRVDELNSYTADSLSVQCVDKSVEYNKTIPLTYFTQEAGYDYPPTPEVLATPIPLTYGTFTFDRWNPTAGTGMMEGFPATNKIQRPPFKFASHAVLSIDGLYLKQNRSALDFYTYFTTTIAEAKAQGNLGAVYFFMFPLEHSSGDYAFVDSEQTNEANALDGSASTYAGVEDFYDDGTTRKAKASYVFSEDEESVFDMVASINSERALDTDMVVRYKIGQQITITGLKQLLVYHIVTGAGTGTAIFTHSPTMDATERDGSMTLTPAQIGAKEDHYCLVVHGETSTAGANSTINDQTLINIYRLVMYGLWYYSRVQKGSNPPEETGWASGTGRAYGTWIDNAGRSNSKNATNLIDNTSGVIESLLRDELGVTTALIDEASFDSAIDALGVNFNMQILERKPVFDYIKQLCEQSYFMFTWSGAGKARLVMLNDTIPTTQRTVPCSHIKDGKVTVKRQKPFCNTLNYKSRWREFYGEYFDTATLTDATSVTNYGTLTYNAEWPNLVGAEATALAGHFIGSSTGIWSLPHNVIDFETLGVTSADLECGDWIELEAASVDGQVKLFGATWSGKKFVVTDVKQTIDSTKITAMQLY